METKNKNKKNEANRFEQGGKVQPKKISKIRVRSNSERFPPHTHCKTIHTCSEGASGGGGGMNTCTNMTQHQALIMVGDSRFSLWDPIVSCICITPAVSRRSFKGFSPFQGRTMKLGSRFWNSNYVPLTQSLDFQTTEPIFVLRQNMSKLRTSSHFLPLNCS